MSDRPDGTPDDDAHDKDPAPSSEESQWQGLIASFGEAPRFPSALDEVPGARLTPASSDWDPLADDDAGFQPPEPPPIPRPHHIADRLGWAGAIGGPLVVLLAFFLSLDGWVAALGGISFVAGFVTLVARKPDGRRDEGDDGAVV